MVRSSVGLGAMAILLAALPWQARADVTLRYHATLKMGAMLPPQAAGALPQMPDTIVQLHGSQARVDGAMTEILDLSRQQCTLLDPPHERYATVPLNDLAAEMSAAMPKAATSPAARQMLANMQFAVDSRVTGKTDTILGVQVQETLLTMTMTMKAPATANPAAAAALQGPLVRIEMSVWTSLPAESQRLKPLAELESFSQLQQMLFMGGAQSGMDALPPQFREGMQSAMKAIQKAQGALLRMHMTMYMPMMAAIIQMARAKQGAGAPPNPALDKLDPSAPLGEVTMEATQLSADAVDPAVFAIPSAYQPEPLADLMKAMQPAARH